MLKVQSSKIKGLLAIFGEVESAGTSEREMESSSLRNDTVFPPVLWTEKRCKTSKPPRFTKYGQEPLHVQIRGLDPRTYHSLLPWPFGRGTYNFLIIKHYLHLHIMHHTLGKSRLAAIGHACWAMHGGCRWRAHAAVPWGFCGRQHRMRGRPRRPSPRGQPVA
jgi:hypothetical protein